MSRSRPPLLERPALVWLLAAGIGLTCLGLVLTGCLPSWVGGLLHVLALSLTTYGLFAWDKRRARREGRRVSEANLLWLALLGGSLGAWTAMHRLRHKTQHLRFRLLVPLAVLAHAGGIAWLAARP